MPHTCRSQHRSGPAELGGFRTFAGTCSGAKLAPDSGPSRPHPRTRSCRSPRHRYRPHRPPVIGRLAHSNAAIGALQHVTRPYRWFPGCRGSGRCRLHRRCWPGRVANITRFMQFEFPCGVARTGSRGALLGNIRVAIDRQYSILKAVCVAIWTMRVSDTWLA